MAPQPEIPRVADLHFASPKGLAYLTGFAASCYVLYTILFAIYHLYFAPLARIPGRPSWLVFPVLKHVSMLRGLYDIDARDIHTKYGPVVRITPTEVSFINAQAWADIYGWGHRQLPKTKRFGKDETVNIINANDADHTRFRKALSHGFSEKALRDQEPIIKQYIDLLIEKLRDVAASGIKTDMVKWYNYTTFDLIGDLAFGAPFNCLRDAKTHFWIVNLFRFIRMGPFVRAAHYYPILTKFLTLLMPKNMQEARKLQFSWTRDTVTKRINNEEQHGRGDFMDSMLRHKNNKDELSHDELVSNANILIIAGSETTATLLSGVTYHLLKAPETLRRATEEVRSTFQREEDINFITASSSLHYMLACLNEALRLYPPVPTSFPRVTLPGGPTTVAGVEVPPNTIVGVHQSAAYWSPLNFHDPMNFHPERWLPSAKEPSSPFYNDNRDVLQPFHVGPRNCIGKNLAYNEMRLVLARVLWNFDLSLCEESENWPEQKTYVLWEKGALNCVLRKRKDLQ